MKTRILQGLLCVASVLLGAEAHKTNKASSGRNNFVSHRLLPDGEEEVRVSYKGIIALQTSVIRKGDKGLYLRELTNGKKLVQAIYKGKDHLVDCDLTGEPTTVGKFIKKFSGKEVIKPVHKKAYKLGRVSMSPHMLSSNTTFRPIGDGQTLPKEYEHLTNFITLRKECRRLHKKLRKELEVKKKLQAAAGDRRSRRMFIYPGTNWCGSGNVAKSYEDLGTSLDADKCCRAHDHCPLTIGGFTSKYSIFNYKFHTLSHCECDERFRTCLKTASTGVANWVGSIYFNMVGTSCFEFRVERVCVERSWWGRCTRLEEQYQAEIRETNGF